MKRLLPWLTKPLLLHWLLPYLMGLVLLGTVAEKYVGLYRSQQWYFSSWIFWAGIIPLPGGRTVCALLLISLLSKLIIDSPWRKATAGIFIAHLGVLLLLLGGLVTATFSLEGYAALAPGEHTNNFSDYHVRELTISKNGKPLLQLPLEQIISGQPVKTNLPFTLHVIKLCRNCTMALREGGSQLKDIAQKVTLSPVDDYLEDERNLSGVEFAITGTGKEADGTYIAFEPVEKQPTFTLGKDNYTIALGRENYAFPFTLQLLHAEREVHPGTGMARSYSSTVMLSDGAIQQRAVITMNHPLRYKGYTVYESSFNDDGDSGSVSFAVVKNTGRVFPYVASITLCIGLLIHLSMRLPPLLRRKTYAA